MARLEKVPTIVLAAIVAMLPFELRTFPIISNLQWLFVAIALASVPLLYRERYRLLRHRLVITAAVFVFMQGAAALAAVEFRPNAAKGAIRVAAGFVLFCIVLCIRNRDSLMRIWCVAAGAAALYGLADYAGLGVPDLFRTAEFYFIDVLRLSGSFEYPNTAAAFFAMSLPIVWLTPRNVSVRFATSALVLVALFLTYSRGAVVALALMVLAWAVAGGSKDALSLGGLGAGLYMALAVVQPFLIQRLRQPQPDKALAADYNPDFNLMHHRPREMGELKVTIRNTGSAVWFPDGSMPVTLSYHWYDTDRQRLATVAVSEPPLPQAVRPGESVSVNASFSTPYEPGHYLLIWDLAQKGRGWFSANGVVPGIVESDIQQENEIRYGKGDVSHWLRVEKAADATVTRGLLWRAALRLAVRNPILGAGPDNFRLLYGRVLEFSSWDTNIRANSLYLELLVGSGVLGLLAFILMIVSIPRHINVATLSIGVFLIHGIADVFLMTTPIYFAFWILMGFAEKDI